METPGRGQVVTRGEAMLADIIGWHRAVGAPLGGFLLSGITAAEVASTLASVGIGVEGGAVDGSCDPYSSSKGVDQEAWDQASHTPTQPPSCP